MQLAGKKIVVTGGSDGLGLAIVKALLAKKAEVYVLARDQVRLQAVQKLGAITHQVDVRSYPDLESLATEIGSIDVLINNAGVWIEGVVTSHEVAEIEQALDINLKGVIFASKAFLPFLQKETESHLINVVSTSGLRGRNGQAVYCASKFGVTGFTESLKLDLEKSNVKVTGFYPGGMHTHLFDKAGSPKANQDWMDVNKVAEVLVFMLERDVSMVLDHVVLNKRMTATSN